MIDREALKLALEALITASGHLNNEAFVKVMMARDAVVEALAQMEQERIGFAGVKIWVGDQQVVKLLTQTELDHAYDPCGLLEQASEICIATLKEMNE